jgi:hypothetical protein
MEHRVNPDCSRQRHLKCNSGDLSDNLKVAYELSWEIRAMSSWYPQILCQQQDFMSHFEGAFAAHTVSMCGLALLGCANVVLRRLCGISNCLKKLNCSRDL